MHPEDVADCALDLPGATVAQPFGPQVDVYKVAGKIFAIVSPKSDPPSVSLKCEPTLALHLRATYRSVIPGYHLNKSHWNTVLLDGSIPGDAIREMVDHSYERVVAGLARAVRLRLGAERPTTKGRAPLP